MPPSPELLMSYDSVSCRFDQVCCSTHFMQETIAVWVSEPLLVAGSIATRRSDVDMYSYNRANADSQYQEILESWHIDEKSMQQPTLPL